MERLWAPWRLEYIQGPREDSCIFCLANSPNDDEKQLVLLRGDYSFVMMNRYPYSNGHLMVAPFRHLNDFRELNDTEALEIFRLTVLCQRVLRQECRAEGFNLGWNIGAAAGAGIADHIHQHLVPRWAGDTNYMTVFADVRVVPEHIDKTYATLRNAMQSQFSKT